MVSGNGNIDHDGSDDNPPIHHHHRHDNGDAHLHRRLDGGDDSNGSHRNRLCDDHNAHHSHHDAALKKKMIL